MTPLSKLKADLRVQLMGHIVRLPSTRPAKKALEWIPNGGKQPRSWPKKTWHSTIKKIFMNVEPTSFKPFKMQQTTGIGETLKPIAVLWMEDPGNQNTKQWKHLRVCLYVTKVKSHPMKKLNAGWKNSVYMWNQDELSRISSHDDIKFESMRMSMKAYEIYHFFWIVETVALTRDWVA